MVADLLAARMGARFKRDRSGAVVAAGRLSGLPVTLGKPLSYMNLSGRPVAALRSFYKIPAERVLVVHDDLDIPFGAIRLKLGGGDNGHNGLRSVTAALATRDYYRARVGIGRPPGRMDAAAFVRCRAQAATRADRSVRGCRAGTAGPRPGRGAERISSRIFASKFLPYPR